jgi:hypothetical protein
MKAEWVRGGRRRIQVPGLPHRRNSHAWTNDSSDLRVMQTVGIPALHSSGAGSEINRLGRP